MFVLTGRSARKHMHMDPDETRLKQNGQARAKGLYYGYRACYNGYAIHVVHKKD